MSLVPEQIEPDVVPPANREPKRVKVQSRNEPFSARAATRIWAEQPSSDNPYIAHYCPE